jgi:hypothetical protein
MRWGYVNYEQQRIWKEAVRRTRAQSGEKGLYLYGKDSKNYKLITMLLSDQFLGIISISKPTDLHYSLRYIS